MDTAELIELLDHPKEFWRGMINTEGAALNPDVATRVKKVITAAIHAGCSRLDLLMIVWVY
jgi:hypothetical protein